MWSLASSLSVRSSVLIPARLTARRSLSFSARSRTLKADEHVRLGGVGVAVVELGDVAAPEQAAELLEAAGSLRDRRREDGLAGLAEIGPLRDEAEPVEVHVRATEHGDEVPAADALLLDVALRAGDAERRRRLDDRARVLEDVLHRGAELVGVDEDHVVDVARASRKGSTPTCLTATPSAKRPTWGRVTRRPARSERSIAFASSGSTPTTLISGRRRFT